MSRRIFRRLCLLVALGGLTTVIIAWGSSLLRLPRGVGRVAIHDINPTDIDRDDQVVLRAWQDLDCEVFLAGTRRSDVRWGAIPMPEFMRPQEVDARELVPSWAWWELTERYDSNSRPTASLRWLAAFGWPFSALWYEYNMHLSSGYSVAGGWMIEVPWKRWSGRDYYVNQLPVILTYRPIWSGLFLNTAFHTSLWAIFLFAPGITRRALRRSRGLCPRCAYDLRSLPPSSPCPECGPERSSGSPLPL
jgi:hypothetical protein